MNDQVLVQRLLGSLTEVQLLREAQARDTGMGLRVQAIKAYQQRRFASSYSDFLCSPRYQAAASFFLEQLYGPGDQTLRDAQFARVVPAVVRLFPESVCDLVEGLVSLHVLTENLDHAMAQHLTGFQVTSQAYTLAWQATGQAAKREHQLHSVVSIGRQLDVLTRRRWLGKGLRLMRPAAAAAGLSDLQRFLESGMDAFAQMAGASEFLQIIHSRESHLMQSLFSAQQFDTNEPST